MLAAGLLGALIGPVTRAQDLYDLSLDKLSDLVITDTKTGQAQDTVTQKVEVLRPREFDQQPAYDGNIASLLRSTSGQFVNPLSRNDANWGSFGGLGPKYSGYLLDGLPIDSFADAMSLDPWILGRIELHRGPASVMYSNFLTMDFAGNEAPLAGITNFVLRDRIDGPVTRFEVGGGSYATFTGRLYHQDRQANFQYFLGATLEQSDYTNYGTADSWLHILRPPEYRKTRVYAKLTYLFDRDDHKLSLFANRTLHSGDAGRPNRDFSHRYDTVNGAYSNQLTEALNLQLKAGLRSYDRRWGEDDFPTGLGLREHDRVRQLIIPSDLTLNLAHAGRSLLTMGVDSQVARYETDAEVDGVRRTGTRVGAWSAGLFLQEKLVLQSWVLRLGGRFTHTGHTYDLFAGVTPTRHGNSWDTPLWSAGARYNASPRLAVYANAGSSFVAPSAKQLGGTLNAASLGAPGANGQLPNLDLTPEKGNAIDLGLELRPLDGLTVGVRGSYSRIDDAIVENVVSTTPSQTMSMNVGSARSIGFELNVAHQATDWLSWFANLTLAATRVENRLDPDQDGAAIPFVPDQLANVGLTARLPARLQVSPSVHLVGTYYDSTSKAGRRRFGPYPVLNLRARKTLIAAELFEAHVTLDLNNLLD